MKTLVSIFLFLFSTGIIAQSKLVISDTIKVKYKTSQWVGIDSTVIINSNEEGYCKFYEVYFDKNFRTLAYKSVVIGDSCIEYDFWRNGKLKKKTIYLIDEVQSPIWWYDELYCANGSLIFEGPSPNQKGRKHYIHYYCNGNKREEFEVENVGVYGLMRTWYENGNLQSDSYYENSTPIGKWTYYDKNQKVNKVEIYKKGELIETKNY